MKILAADDERMSLNILTRAIKEALPEADVRSVQTVSKAFEELSAGFIPDVAFLDIEMPEMSGLDLARLINAQAPKVNIIFVTGYSRYALEAMATRPSGYLMKPVDKEQILTEISNLRNPPERSMPKKEIFVKCFGDFEIFVNGQTVAFSRAKSKELLAYLVDRRGANCTSAKIAEAMWEDGVYDRARQKLFSSIYADMMKALRLSNADKIVKKTNNAMAIDTETFDCDYYMALNGDESSINSFMGEYMAAYSWAELTTAALTSMFQPEHHDK